MKKSENTLPKFFILYKGKRIDFNLPTKEGMRQGAKNAAASMGLFGMSMNGFASVDDIYNKIKENNDEFVNLIKNGDYQKFSSLIFLSKDNPNKIVAVSKKEALKFNYPVLEVCDITDKSFFFLREDADAASNHGLDFQNILMESILQRLGQEKLLFKEDCPRM